MHTGNNNNKRTNSRANAHNCYALLTSPNLLIFFQSVHTKASTNNQQQGAHKYQVGDHLSEMTVVVV
jgi:hypothetical protein